MDVFSWNRIDDRATIFGRFTEPKAKVIIEVGIATYLSGKFEPGLRDNCDLAVVNHKTHGLTSISFGFLEKSPRFYTGRIATTGVNRPLSLLKR